jgi:hypothetical protein
MKEDMTINKPFPFSINKEYKLSYSGFLQKISLNAQLIDPTTFFHVPI